MADCILKNIDNIPPESLIKAETREKIEVTGYLDAMFFRDGRIDEIMIKSDFLDELLSLENIEDIACKLVEIREELKC